MIDCDQVVDKICPAYLGNSVSGTITFTATKKISWLDCQMETFDMKISCPNPNGCKSLGKDQGCPIKPGTKVTYHILLEYLTLPSVSEVVFSKSA